MIAPITQLEVEGRTMSQRILVVEDDPAIVKIVRGYLEQAGYAVLTAEDGDRALQIVRHERPDLVVLDVMLPNRDGWGDYTHDSCGQRSRRDADHLADCSGGRNR